jgi:thiol-disulfide isomerase/thioredoxin
MNLYYIIIAIIILLLIFPSINISLLDDILKYFNLNSTQSTKYKFEKFNNSGNKIVFVAYTADWCPHCVDFKNKSYNKLLKAFKNNPNIEIANVDCTNDNGKIKTYAGNSINGFPTLVINKYNNGNMDETMYEGPRDAESIINYLKNL